MFDLDGVICTEENTFDRPLAKPIPGVKEYLTHIKRSGHTIIIETSRSWAEYKVTKHWLIENQIPHDALIMGKAIADIRIDDRAIRFTTWDAVSVYIENMAKGLTIDFPNDEYFLQENRRVIFSFLTDLSKQNLPEPIIEVGPMEESTPVATRFPSFYIDTHMLFKDKNFHTFGITGKVDYRGNIEQLDSHFEESSIGTLIMLSVLEHLNKPWLLPFLAHKILKPDGLLCLQVPWNLRLHGPRPDCWRISDDGLHALFGQYFDFLCLDKVNAPDRELMPICFTAILRNKK